MTGQARQTEERADHWLRAVAIGQAAEFDYAGTQACRALRAEGSAVRLGPGGDELWIG